MVAGLMMTSTSNGARTTDGGLLKVLGLARSFLLIDPGPVATSLR